MYESIFDEIHKNAEYLGLSLKSNEIAAFISSERMSENDMEAIRKVFKYLQEKKYETTVDFLLRTSKLPGKEPKTFDNFDFSRIQGKDSPEVTALKELPQLYARKNVGFIGNTKYGCWENAPRYGLCSRSLQKRHESVFHQSQSAESKVPESPEGRKDRSRNSILCKAFLPCD